MGKSTTLKHIALEWAGDKQHLERFDYVYHIALKHVKAGQTIPELIVKQHKLKALGVSVHEIQAILEGSTQQQVSSNYYVSTRTITKIIYEYSGALFHVFMTK